MHKMKHIMILACLLAGCSQEPGTASSVKKASLPTDVRQAVSVLLSAHEDTPEVTSALHTLESFDDSMIREIHAMENPSVGEKVEGEIRSFPRLDLSVTFRNGKFMNAKYIQTGEHEQRSEPNL